jgi:hypothetical protein
VALLSLRCGSLEGVKIGIDGDTMSAESRTNSLEVFE